MTVLDLGLDEIPVEVNDLKRNSVFVKIYGDYSRKHRANIYASERI